ncbi:MAG: GNAT family N-acetyltransferase [Gammaproteobacteria bacterium]|nr:GNAT family N-acetyltransferase [Gammaproteobacteria bacterium]
MLEAFALLSPQSRWQRFASGSASLTEAQLDYLTDVDGSSRVACCAVIPDRRKVRGIGIARYVRLDNDPDCAEFAVTVIDRCQGQGVGRALMRHLIGEARRNGIKTLVGNVLPSNTRMLALCRALGATTSRDGDFIRVSLMC